MRTVILVEFARRLAAVRLAYGMVTGRPQLSRARFASELNLEKDTYRRYERGEMEPSLPTLAAIRRLTGISLDYLIADEDQGIAHPSEIGFECTATFAERIRWVRELFCNDIAELAKAMNVSEETIHRWEDGREPMPDIKQEELAHRFKISMAFLRQGVAVDLEPDVLARLRVAHPELWRMTGVGTDRDKAPDTNAP
jgi:transcriptional regulator with XRE-family HTH domain